MRREKYLELKKYIEELKVVSSNMREKSSFITSIPYSFTLNNGKVIEREKLLKNGQDGSAAIIMPITSDNEILTVIEPRVFTERTVAVSFPAGYIEKGKTHMRLYKRTKRRNRIRTRMFKIIR